MNHRNGGGGEEMSKMLLKEKVREQLEAVELRISYSLARRIAAGANGLPLKMDCADGESIGWKMALEWILEEMNQSQTEVMP
jgi:hypothetical protein